MSEEWLVRSGLSPDLNLTVGHGRFRISVRLTRCLRLILCVALIVKQLMELGDIKSYH